MKSKTLVFFRTCLILIGICYLLSVYRSWAYIESISKATGILVFALFYFIHSKRKHVFFGSGLVCFALTELPKVYFKFDYNVFSIYTNTLSILGYLFFISYLFSHLNFKSLVRKYWLHVLFLVFISSYIVINLNSIIFSGRGIPLFSSIYIIETLYNICILGLMSLSFLNFLHHDDKRSFLIFIISIFFCLAEIIQVPFLFLANKNSLHIAYSLLNFSGYYFVYLYITTRYNKQLKVLH